jgi:hypothetical protein
MGFIFQPTRLAAYRTVQQNGKRKLGCVNLRLRRAMRRVSAACLSISFWRREYMKKEMGFICMIALLSTFAGEKMTSAVSLNDCSNPWGGASIVSRKYNKIPELNEIRLCLPSKYTPTKLEDRVQFAVPGDNFHRYGLLSVIINIHETYKSTDNLEQRKQLWCTPPNAVTKCSIATINGRSYVLVETTMLGRPEKAYAHYGDGYMIGLNIAASDPAIMAELVQVVEKAEVPWEK